MVVLGHFFYVRFMARVNVDYAARECGCAGFFKACCFHTLAEGFRAGEFSDAFYEVLIAIFIICNDFSDLRDDVARIGVVSSGEERVFDVAKFEAIKASAWFQDAGGFG